MSICHFDTLLIANRGEIARRIIRACRRLGIRAVAVYSDADVDSPHVAEADLAVRLGPAAAAESYLNIPALLDAAARAGADAVHPGYGFLAENAAFARACVAAGLVFVGPPAEAIAAMGDKRAARRLAAGLGVPVLAGYDGEADDDATLASEAARVGYPLMVKAAAGGGGKGLRLVARPDDLPAALAGARREATAAFGDGRLLLERAVLRPRHVEVQVLADSHGHTLHLGERDCSVQRRHQKVIEESPAPGLSDGLRAEMGAAAVRLAAAIGYTGAGTVEFLLDEAGRFAFLEMNTRLQVEHPVTEMVTGLDLVEWQLRVAAGEPLPWSQAGIAPTGHAVEARLYAENPAADFLPDTGTVLLWQPAASEGVRVDDGIRTGSVVTSHYDPLLAKLIATGPTRADALRRLERALAHTVLLGLTTNLAYLRAIVTRPAFASPAALSTHFLEDELPDWRPAVSAEASAVALIAVTVARWRRLSAAGPGYWRNNPGEPAPFRYRLGGETVDVRLRPTPWTTGQYHVTLPGDASPRLVTLEEDAAPNLTLTIDGARRHVALANAGDTWWAQTDDGPLRLTALPLWPEPHRAVDAAGSLRAPLPGTVLAVLVAVGQRVEEGQALVKIEAMKMEHTIRTAAAGIVEAIHYAPGDSVDADALLAHIRPPDEAPG
ncbi:MAG TPA: biotin carboxylase N-terminal domain-containing protein [Promineifilum sp.]|nr:biotin carboxylase N-terminal domain-containing protein [Promineifilum sp.]